MLLKKADDSHLKLTEINEPKRGIRTLELYETASVLQPIFLQGEPGTRQQLNMQSEKSASMTTNIKTPVGALFWTRKKLLKK